MSILLVLSFVSCEKAEKKPNVKRHLIGLGGIGIGAEIGGGIGIGGYGGGGISLSSGLVAAKYAGAIPYASHGGYGHGIVTSKYSTGLGYSSLPTYGTYGSYGSGLVAAKYGGVYGHSAGYGLSLSPSVSYGISRPAVLTVNRKIPVPVPIPQPYAVPVDRPVAVPIAKPFPVHIPKPYPVHITKPVAVPVPQPYPVPVAVPTPVYTHKTIGINTYHQPSAAYAIGVSPVHSNQIITGNAYAGVTGYGGYNSLSSGHGGYSSLSSGHGGYSSLDSGLSSSNGYIASSHGEYADYSSSASAIHTAAINAGYTFYNGNYYNPDGTLCDKNFLAYPNALNYYKNAGY